MLEGCAALQTFVLGGKPAGREEGREVGRKEGRREGGRKRGGRKEKEGVNYILSE